MKNLIIGALLGVLLAMVALQPTANRPDRPVDRDIVDQIKLIRVDYPANDQPRPTPTVTPNGRHVTQRTGSGPEDHAILQQLLDLLGLD